MSNQKIAELITVDSLPLDIESDKMYSISQQNPNRYTHSYFKYPCRFIPEIPRWAIKRYLKNENEIIFDPFSGSGTTLLEGVINGYDAYGTEIDFIAKLIIKVKTTSLSTAQIKLLPSALQMMIKASFDKNAGKTIPKINNLNHWFTDENATKLGRILYAIDKIEDMDVRDFFKVCFISMVKRCSNADDISPKPYVSSRIKKNPAEPAKELENIFNRYFQLMNEYSQLNIKNKVILTSGDALHLSFDKKINIAITSPPYINAFDYARTLRLENLWLGTLSEDVLRNRKKLYVGTEQFKISEEENNLEILNESQLLKTYYERIYLIDKKRALVVKKFFHDMKTNLFAIYNQLEYGGHYMIVIGNSFIRNVEIESWRVLEELAVQIGYDKDIHFSYMIQNPYIRIPRGEKSGRINSDHVLVLKKGGAGNGTKR